MDASFLDLFMLLLFGGAFVYSMYTYIKLRRTGQLFDNKLLYPGGCARSDCSDEEGYIAFIGPKILVFSLICLLAFICEALLGYVLPNLPMAFHIGAMVIEVAAFVWLALGYNAAAKRFW